MDFLINLTVLTETNNQVLKDGSYSKSSTKVQGEIMKRNTIIFAVVALMLLIIVPFATAQASYKRTAITTSVSEDGTTTYNSKVVSATKKLVSAEKPLTNMPYPNEKSYKNIYSYSGSGMSGGGYAGIDSSTPSVDAIEIKTRTDKPVILIDDLKKAKQEKIVEVKNVKEIKKTEIKETTKISDKKSQPSVPSEDTQSQDEAGRERFRESVNTRFCKVLESKDDSAVKNTILQMQYWSTFNERAAANWITQADKNPRIMRVKPYLEKAVAQFKETVNPKVNEAVELVNAGKIEEAKKLAIEICPDFAKTTSYVRIPVR